MMMTGERASSLFRKIFIKRDLEWVILFCGKDFIDIQYCTVLTKLVL